MESANVKESICGSDTARNLLGLINRARCCGQAACKRELRGKPSGIFVRMLSVCPTISSESRRRGRDFAASLDCVCVCVRARVLIWNFLLWMGMVWSLGGRRLNILPHTPYYTTPWLNATAISITDEIPRSSNKTISLCFRSAALILSLSPCVCARECCYVQLSYSCYTHICIWLLHTHTCST